MDDSEKRRMPDSLYLEVSTENKEHVLPLHSSITLFLLSYCESTSFRVILLSAKSGDQWTWVGDLSSTLAANPIQLPEPLGVVGACRLPAVLEADGMYCRAGLAVVLRHVIQRTSKDKPGHLNLTSLLGFKNTCLKACAEVSKWTRLCEIDIPSAVEEHLSNPTEQALCIPPAVLHLEKRLDEPVKVHNDDKLRRRKLQQQAISSSPSTLKEERSNPALKPCGVELSAALAKLTTDEVPDAATKRPPDIRRVKTTQLPKLERHFAEGLYFTLTDVVLLPCIHQYLSSLQKHAPHALSRLPLLVRWYCHVQDVPGVRKAAETCGMTLFTPQPSESVLLTPEISTLGELELESTQPEKVPFVGGPRPTLTKLKESGVEAVYSPHPCPSWTVPWEDFPTAVNPTTGEMSDTRAIRKCQQINNLVAMVTELVHPGNTVVDFCSGGGHVGIVLASMLPQCQVILVENKEESLVRARERSVTLNLTNISFIQTNLDYYIGAFHIGVALHACGVATDMVLQRCVQAGAAFVISPCCYGFIQNTQKFTFPRSQLFSKILDYKVKCGAYDLMSVRRPDSGPAAGRAPCNWEDLHGFGGS
ncbi:glutathione S-transferase C-terminal domain-containing protein isoform X2 [Clupea harengus]|uniref:Glutathione S-transferase C-terminal domain-containing protein n=1 Tax=Clupea harengus TaxID=7950 RepID=A0A6P8G065_CLUHA|nr:glutathione S-transferase C-terminal domain-containing protein isoform X2 [Clupea harengus]